MGTQPLRVLLEPWCRRLRLSLPSESTIGRIIAAAEDKMRTTPARLDSRGRPKTAKKQNKERRPAGHAAEPLEVFAADAIVRVYDGVRSYLITFIDPRSRFAFCWASKRASSHYAAQALRTLLFLLHRPMRWVLTDNGSEFGKDFENELKKHGIGHWWTYPRSP